MDDLTHVQLVDLRDKLVRYFSDSEIRGLCFELGEDYENLPGQAKTDKILSLVQLCQRKSLLRQLLDRCAQQRPKVAWPGPSRPSSGSPTPTPMAPPGGTTLTFNNTGVHAGQVIQGQTVNVDSAPASGGAVATKYNTPSRAKPHEAKPELKPKIVILFLAANPKDTDALRLGEEVRTIDERLQLAKFRERFELEQAHAVRVGDIGQALLRYQPHIVHFSGHGSTSGDLIFEDATGASQPVTAKALGGLFKALKDNMRCVVLSACWSNQQAQAIAKEIDCVVGMSRSISDAAAIDFAAGFYQGLGFGRSVKNSYELGCAQINLQGLPEAATPRLKAKVGVDLDKIKFA